MFSGQYTNRASSPRSSSRARTFATRPSYSSRLNGSSGFSCGIWASGAKTEKVAVTNVHEDGLSRDVPAYQGPYAFPRQRGPHGKSRRGRRAHCDIFNPFNIFNLFSIFNAFGPALA